MTEQITIKLNKKRFEPVFKELQEYGHNIMTSNSALAAFAIWFLYDHCFEVYPELGMTKAEWIFKRLNKPKEKSMIDMLERYGRFKKGR